MSRLRIHVLPLVRFLLLSSFLLAATPASAEFNCAADFQLGVLVDDNHIRVMKKGRTQYQINPEGQLIVRGQWVKVNPEVRQTLLAYERGLRDTVPEMVLLATEGVELAISTVKSVYLNLLGEDAASVERFQAALSRAQQKVHRKYVHAGDHYFIGPRSVENIDELIDNEIEQELDNAFNTTIGGLLTAIGGLPTEQLSENTDAPRQANTLRNKARWFCAKLTQLDNLETQLQTALPILRDANLIAINQKARQLNQ